MFFLVKVLFNFSLNFLGYFLKGNELVNYLLCLVVCLSEDKFLWFLYWEVMGDYFFLLEIKNFFIIYKEKWCRCIYVWFCVEVGDVEG